MLFSAVALGFSSVLMKKYSKDENPVVISGYQFIMGGIAMVLIGIVFGGKIVVSGGKALGVLTYLSFLSAAAYAIWGVLLKNNPVSVTVYSFMTPLWAFCFQFAAYGAKRRFRRESGRYACACVCGNSYFELQKRRDGTGEADFAGLRRRRLLGRGQKKGAPHGKSSGRKFSARGWRQNRQPLKDTGRFCAAQPLSVSSVLLSGAQRAISRTPHTKLPFCTVEVFARPAHVRADKRVFNLFLQAGGGKFSALSLVL